MVSDEQLRQTVAEVFGTEVGGITNDVPLHTYVGFDSVQMLTLMVALDEVGVVITADEIGKLRTFGDILALQRK